MSVEVGRKVRVWTQYGLRRRKWLKGVMGCVVVQGRRDVRYGQYTTTYRGILGPQEGLGVLKWNKPLSIYPETSISM